MKLKAQLSPKRSLQLSGSSVHETILVSFLAWGRRLAESLKKQDFDSPLKAPIMGSSFSLWNVGTLETFYLGLSTKNETGKSSNKREIICPIHTTYLCILSQDEYPKKKKKRERENWFSHNVFSLTAFKILTLTNKLYSNPCKHVLKTSQQNKHLWCVAEIWSCDEILISFFFPVSRLLSFTLIHPV